MSNEKVTMDVPRHIREEDVVVSHKIKEKMGRLKEILEPYEMAVTSQLRNMHYTLEGLSHSLWTDTDLNSQPHVNLGSVASDPMTSSKMTHADDYVRRASTDCSVRTNESFQSALSDLGHMPVVDDCMDRSLLSAWLRYKDKIMSILESDASTIVQLETESSALKFGIYNVRCRAQQNAKRVEYLDKCNATLSSDSEDLDIADSVRSRSRTEDLQPFNLEMNSDYKEAIAALEVVRRHNFAVSAATAAAGGSGSAEGSTFHRRCSECGASNAEVPDDIDAADIFDDNADVESVYSEDDKSDMTQIATPKNVWHVASTRVRLPNPAPASRGFSIWSVLKSAIGKDLTRITLPATINEPLSALQRIAEDLEYSYLLDRAISNTDPCLRMLYVAAFVASTYSGTLERDNKPFNPLLGETYEWRSADESVRMVCEQVSHHPPVSCWFSESVTGWRYGGEIEMKSKFWGTSVEMLPVGHTVTLQLPKCGGSLEKRGVVNCDVTMSHSENPKKMVGYALRGKYTDSLVATAVGHDAAPIEIFSRSPPPDQGELQYNLTKLALTLNTAEPELLRALPPTDSRFRTDQRALEDGKLELATSEKLRLEEKQRKAKKARVESNVPYFPAFFKLKSVTSDRKKGADHWRGSNLVCTAKKGSYDDLVWEFDRSYYEVTDWTEKNLIDLYS